MTDRAGLHDLVKALCDRPGGMFGRWRGDQVPPIVWLISAPGSERPAADLPAHLDQVTHVSVQGTAVPDPPSAGWAPTGSILPELSQAATDLPDILDGVRHSVYFPRYRLVDWLTREDLGDAAGNDGDRRATLVRRLRERRLGVRNDRLGPMSGAQSGAQFLFALVSIFTPLLRFWLWAGGVPGLGRETRWLMRQPFLSPRRAGRFRFLSFAVGLTRGRPAQIVPDLRAEVERLLVHAFLEDLRVAHRRRPWRLHAWRRTAHPVLLLDGPADQAVPMLPGLVADVREQTRQADPLLLLCTVDADVIPEPGAPPVPVPEATRALSDWRRAAGERVRNRRPGEPHRPAAWYLRVGVTAEDVAGLRREPAYPRRRPCPFSWPQVALPTALAVVVAFLIPLGVLLRPYWTASCWPAEPFARTAVRLTVSEGHPDCIGYSSTPHQLFGTKPRLLEDERQIFRQNDDAQRKHAETGRPLAGLVYLAGLSALPGQDSDSAQAEELEGIAVAQREQNDLGSGPLLRVIVANGGEKMLHAATVAGDLLVPLFRRERDLLGVIGLDRSVPATLAAVTILDRAGVPMVTTTLSGDHNEDSAMKNHYYFQLVPPNQKEAELMLTYVERVVPFLFRRYAAEYAAGRDDRLRLYRGSGAVPATAVTVYEPQGLIDARDAYSDSLRNDLMNEAAGRGPDRVPAPRLLTTLDRPRELCGAYSVVIYAGRHDQPVASGPAARRKARGGDFTEFLSTILNNCGNDRPIIVADDAISRFVADPNQRGKTKFSGLSIGYATKGVKVLRLGRTCQRGGRPPDGGMKSFCSGYGALYRNLQSRLDSFGLLWTGERVGVAYDATRLYLRTAATWLSGHPGTTPTAADLVHGFEQPHAYDDSVTGPIDFSTSHVLAGNELAIVQIPELSDSNPPTCEFRAGHPNQPLDTSQADPQDSLCPG